MEGKSVKPIGVMLMITVLVLGMFVGQTTASAGCYAKCYLSCVLKRGPITCAIDCAEQCKKSPTTSDIDLHQYYCNIGADEVEACVNSCSDKCTKGKKY
ncbi:hypothetical protein BVC80_9073g28 [Macleaya cordata]|uniref:Thionin-like protein n=1 Tax=Macleaya cordata TaxID=56857 RepID=A0A200PTM6_MACCD|nr:hypothetical protein BVC80_9073g28 [Macleaya cordata]